MKKIKLYIFIFGLIPQVIFCQLPPYVPINGLVGYWPFSGNANDISGNGNNGTVNGATLVEDRFGNQNSAFLFDGDSNNILIPNNSLFNFQTNNNFSISYWIKPSSLSSTLMNSIISKQEMAGNFQDGWNSYVELTGNIGFRIKNGAQSNHCTSEVTSLLINQSNYYHIVQIYENGISLIYINGVLEYISDDCFAQIGDNSSDIFIGVPSWIDPLTVKGFNGIIDDIGIWNRTLTSNEVTDLFNSNLCFNNITVTDTLIINIGILSFDEPVTWANNITISPNPATTEITINFNSVNNLVGGTLKIINSLGQQVDETPITSTGTNTIMYLNTWGGTGLYFVQILNPQGQIIDIKKIVLQ